MGLDLPHGGHLFCGGLVTVREVATVGKVKPHNAVMAGADGRVCIKVCGRSGKSYIPCQAIPRSS